MRLLDNVQKASVLLRMTSRSCRLELGSDDVDGCKENQIWGSEVARIYEIRRGRLTVHRTGTYSSRYGSEGQDGHCVGFVEVKVAAIADLQRLKRRHVDRRVRKDTDKAELDETGGVELSVLVIIFENKGSAEMLTVSPR